MADLAGRERPGALCSGKQPLPQHPVQDPARRRGRFARL